MDRMSPQDAMFLHVEDANNPMHIGAVSIFDGPPPAYGDLVRMIASKLPLVPRYRQKVRAVPLGMGRPVWVDDPHFQILYHVRHTAVPRPGSADQIRNLSGRIFGQLLDRTKPLWEIWLVEGLAAGRWALISKVHHCMVDGVSATDLLSVLLDTSPDARPRPAPAWVPGPEPTSLRLLADTLGEGVLDPVTRLRGLPALARTPLSGGVGLRDAGRLAASLRHWGRASVGALNGPVGPHRRWGWAEASLADVKVIRTALGGTVNDVVLASITRGFRDLLQGRDEPIEGRVVRTMVPVSMRTESERGVYNNRVAAFFPGLPVGIDDPVARLADIRDQMEGLKSSGQAMAGDALTRMSGFAPPMLLAAGTRLALRFQQRLVQTVTTNVPGPRVPLYVLGRPLRSSFPYVPVAGSVRITIAIFSYEGRLFYGITADYDSVPDLDVLRDGIEAGVAELLRAADRGAGNGRVSPPRRRSRAASPPGVRRTAATRGRARAR